MSWSYNDYSISFDDWMIRPEAERTSIDWCVMSACAWVWAWLMIKFLTWVGLHSQKECLLDVNGTVGEAETHNTSIKTRSSVWCRVRPQFTMTQHRSRHRTRLAVAGGRAPVRQLWGKGPPFRSISHGGKFYSIIFEDWRADIIIGKSKINEMYSRGGI